MKAEISVGTAVWGMAFATLLVGALNFMTSYNYEESKNRRNSDVYYREDSQLVCGFDDDKDGDLDRIKTFWTWGVLPFRGEYTPEDSGFLEYSKRLNLEWQREKDEVKEEQAHEQSYEVAEDLKSKLIELGDRNKDRIFSTNELRVVLDDLGFKDVITSGDSISVYDPKMRWADRDDDYRVEDTIYIPKDRAKELIEKYSKRLSEK